MKRYRLADSGDRGWFIGDFDKAIWKTDTFEVAFMTNVKGDQSKPHYHKIAREISLIIKGHVLVNGEEFRDGDMFEFLPGEAVESCIYLEDTWTLCVKEPSAQMDKYYYESKDNVWHTA